MPNQIIIDLQKKLYQIKERAQSILDSFALSDTYTVSNGSGSVENYRYFIYPYKNFTATNPQDENFLAKHIAMLIDESVDYIVTFEADGIGIGKLVSVLINKPLIVCKPFHYNQPVFSFIQKTGYFTREMYCPTLIDGKKIVIIDCIVSTGGTIQGFLEGLKNNLPDTQVEGIYSVVNKLNYHEKNPFGDIRYCYLFNLIVNEQKKVEVVVSDDFRETFWKDINSAMLSASNHLAINSDLSRNAFKVGSIILDNKTFEIVGWGYKGQEKHAEQVAIEQAEKEGNLSGRDLSIYSTLEPCVARTIPGQISCSELIRSIPSITWVVIGERDSKDENNFNRGVEMLVKSKKHIIAFDHHPSIPLNYSKELSSRKYFSDIVLIDWEKVAEHYQKTIDNEYILEPLVLERTLLIVSEKSVVLDLGCGTGQLSFEISKKAGRVLGIDKSARFIQDAQRLYKNENLEYITIDASDFKTVVENKSVDIVVSNLVFLVVPTLQELQKIFSEISRVLKDGGLLVFSTSHPCFEHRTIQGIKVVECQNYNYFKRNDQYGVTLLDSNQKPTVSFEYYHRTLGDLIGLLSENGFNLQNIVETKPSEVLLEKFPQLKSELEFPPFIVIEAKKEAFR